LKNFDMGKWFQLFAVDVLNRNAFSDSPGFLERGADVDEILETVFQRHVYYNTWGAVPDLEYLLHKNPLARRLGSPTNRLAALARSQLQRRKSEKERGDHTDFMRKYLEGKAKYPDTISETNVIGMLVSSIGAGSDTTGMTLTATFFFMMKQPAILSKLTDEVDTAVKEGKLSHPPRWIEVSKLPYLDAVLKESMRLHPVISSGLDRVVPPGGRTIAGTFLPAGTIVACNAEALHRDEEVFGEKTDIFRPERWLEAPEARLKKMERASLGFGCGKRICPGRHVAMLEMKKLIPLLLLEFDVSISMGSIGERS
jgi:cytochrome P450